jgi:esterase/lipase
MKFPSKNYIQNNEYKEFLWIPGLGANEVMFLPLIKELNKIYNNNIKNTFFKYYDIKPFEFDTLEKYSDYLIQKNKLKLNKSYDVVIGCSLGGMILQILLSKQKIYSKKFILLSTAFKGKDLTLLAKILSILMYNLPVLFRKPLQYIISYSYRIYRYNIKYVYQFSKMFEEFPTNVFFEAPKWIYQWIGINPFILFNKNIYTIHGTSDPLISYKQIEKSRRPNLVFKKGNHILFSLYPKILAEKIARFLES